MSRRDKQADLRRRMADARAKLVSTQTTAGELDVAANANSVVEDDAPSSITTIGKKRPLPPSSSSGGGILRKPKYNTNPAAAIESNVANISMKEDDGHKMNTNALGSLMADYSSSDDDDDKDNNNSAATKHPEPSSYDEIQNNDIHIQGEKHTDNEPTVNNSTTSIQIPAKKKKKKSAAPAQLESTHIITKQQPKIIDEGGGLKIKSTQFNGEKNELLMGETAKLKATEGEEKETSKSTTEVSDEVWDEFNALLDDDEVKANDAPSTSAKDDQPLKSEEIDASTTETTDDSTKKKSKKEKKKKKKQPKDMYDNTEMNNVIQASYEGRLGRLMLLKSKKASSSSSSKHQNNNKGENGMEDNDIAQEEFYDGGLAFQHDNDGDDHDNDDDTQQLKTGVESTTTATISTQKSGESDSRADTNHLLASSAADAQPISLANILRNRRDKARQLSRGQNNDARKEDIEVEDEDDGRWF